MNILGGVTGAITGGLQGLTGGGGGGGGGAGGFDALFGRLQALNEQAEQRALLTTIESTETKSALDTVKTNRPPA